MLVSCQPILIGWYGGLLLPVLPGVATGLYHVRVLQGIPVKSEIALPGSDVPSCVSSSNQWHESQPVRKTREGQKDPARVRMS